VLSDDQCAIPWTLGFDEVERRLDGAALGVIDQDIGFAVADTIPVSLVGVYFRSRTESIAGPVSASSLKLSY